MEGEGSQGKTGRDGSGPFNPPAPGSPGEVASCRAIILWCHDETMEDKGGKEQGEELSTPEGGVELPDEEYGQVGDMR